MSPRKSEKDKEVADREKLLRAWRRWHGEQLKEALAGVHGDVLRRLMAQLENLRSARELVDAISAEDWAAVDADVRLTALHEINRAITKLRERLDEETPIDDGVVGDNAFRAIKKIFESFPHQRGGHGPALANPGKW